MNTANKETPTCDKCGKEVIPNHGQATITIEHRRYFQRGAKRYKAATCTDCCLVFLLDHKWIRQED